MNIFWGNIKVSEIDKVESFGTYGGRQIPKLCLSNGFSNILNTVWIFSRKHEMEILENGTGGAWKNPGDPANMFSKVVKLGSISIQKHEMKIWWYGMNIFQKAKKWMHLKI